MNLLLDYLAYVSYKTQRDAGLSAEICSHYYPNAYSLEVKYQLELTSKKN